MLPNLPRLAYVGDVPSRAISAGPALLYRLFECYPADKLLICEDRSNSPYPKRQLAAAERLLAGQRDFSPNTVFDIFMRAVSGHENAACSTP